MAQIDKLEKKIVRECNQEHKTKFKPEDLMEWSSALIEPRADEIIYKLSYGLYLAFREKAKQHGPTNQRKN